MNIHIKISAICGLLVLLLQVGLIVCKLLGLISWSWVIVWIPTWGSIALVTAVFLLAVFLYVLLFDKGGH